MSSEQRGRGLHRHPQTATAIQIWVQAGAVSLQIPSPRALHFHPEQHRAALGSLLGHTWAGLALGSPSTMLQMIDQGAAECSMAN